MTNYRCQKVLTLVVAMLWLSKRITCQFNAFLIKHHNRSTETVLCWNHCQLLSRHWHNLLWHWLPNDNRWFIVKAISKYFENDQWKVQSWFLATVALAHIYLVMPTTYGQRVGDVMANFGHHFLLSLLPALHYWWAAVQVLTHTYFTICRCPLLWPFLHLCHLGYLLKLATAWQLHHSGS